MDNTALVTNAYNQIAEKYTDQYFYDATDYPFVDNFLHLLPVDGKILDVGSGPGNFSRYIKEQGYAIEGVDLSEKMIEISRQKVPNVSFSLMDMRQLNHPADTFDGLIVPYSLIHIASKDIPKTLDGFWRVLKPGGIILIIAQAGEPDRIVDETLMAGLKVFINFFTRNRLKTFLANAKFETIFQQEQHTDDLESFSDRIIYTIARKV